MSGTFRQVEISVEKEWQKIKNKGATEEARKARRMRFEWHEFSERTTSRDGICHPSRDRPLSKKL